MIDESDIPRLDILFFVKSQHWETKPKLCPIRLITFGFSRGVFKEINTYAYAVKNLIKILTSQYYLLTPPIYIHSKGIL